MHDKTPQRNSRRNPSGARLEHDRRSASAPSSERERSPRRPSAPRPSQERASKAAPSSHRRTNVQRGLSELKLFNAFPSTGSGPIYVGSHAGSESKSPLQRIVPLAVMAAIVVILGVFVLPSFISSCSQAGSADPAAEEGTAVEPVARTVSYTPSVESIDAIADPGENVAGFTLVTEGDSHIPSLSDEQQASIQAALAPFAENDRTVGFCIVDLQTGSGYAYNIDEQVYGASSFKGPYLVYVCQEVLEPGNLSVGAIDDLAADTITWSDNSSYHKLRYTCEGYEEKTLPNWLADMNISTTLATDTAFPHYAPRDSLKLWMNAYLYFQTGDEDLVTWMEDLFSSTEFSMIRDAVELEEMSGEEALEEQYVDFSTPVELASARLEESRKPSVTVYDKGGWIGGEEDNALIDAGIVVEGDRAYLFTIMTGARDTDANRLYVTALAQAVWDARETLRPADLVEAAGSETAGSEAVESAVESEAAESSVEIESTEAAGK